MYRTLLAALMLAAQSFMPVTGCHRDQIIYFFWMQIGPRTPTGVVLIVGSHLHRMRWRLGLSRELWIQNIEDLGSSWLAG